MDQSEQVYERVVFTLMEALNVYEDEVKPHAKLCEDLGAESIDYLDITFRLEREFGIKIARGELFPELIFIEHEDCLHEGRLTEKGMAVLREKIPFANMEGVQKNTNDTFCVNDLITVDYVYRYITSRLVVPTPETV